MMRKAVYQKEVVAPPRTAPETTVETAARAQAHPRPEAQVVETRVEMQRTEQRSTKSWLSP